MFFHCSIVVTPEIEHYLIRLLYSDTQILPVVLGYMNKTI